jgi:predicted transcriptional regulator
VYNANLNFDIVNKYLEMLQNKGLIEKDGDMYLTTDKGKTYGELAKQLKL